MKNRLTQLVLSVALVGMMLFSLSVIVHDTAQARTDTTETEETCLSEDPQ
jgi:hypothetical protein